MRGILIGLALLASSFVVGAQSVPTLAMLDVTLARGESLPLVGRIELNLTTSDSALTLAELKRWSGVEVMQNEDGTLRLSIVRQPQMQDGYTEKDLLDTFVMDFTEASVLAVKDAYLESHPTLESVQQLASFVSGFITQPTYVNGFNIASKVATQRSGDCTEYAVLTAALARSLEIPARVVIGSVIIGAENELLGFGHAWTEVWFQNRWQIVDAALYGENREQIYYLPASVIKNEGPGFMFGLAGIMNLMPHKLTNIRSVK
ncbi:transglutaminase-like domain-containing protein [Bowmanella sp. JS7-9]|uniref:Transglutaminase-like domain-containing protein n=1 Tax=Pseudobowmanella zhangzhouensis TaxID=1537679 RepID=A0ABW1XJV9_9ALTE|nr:transglutaminase-like domain-containing protein [Bowmanella sp. JS7-9]